MRPAAQRDGRHHAAIVEHGDGSVDLTASAQALLADLFAAGEFGFIRFFIHALRAESGLGVNALVRAVARACPDVGEKRLRSELRLGD